jgi:predicted GIY-YIG superfamily endonuclease
MVCGRRRTTEAMRSSKNEVIERCLEVHDSKYSYPWEDVEYENAHIRMPIICPEHGVFKQSIATHMYRGSGCQSCAQTGFDPSNPGTYYVIEIRNEDGAVILYKGGKTGDIERRLSNHKTKFSKHQRSRSWALRLIETVDFEIGIGAEKLEGVLLRAVDIRAPPIKDLSSELFLHNPLDYARERRWV